MTAPRLLCGINCTTLNPAAIPPPDKSLPTHARCTFDPSLARGTSPLPPTFLLALTFPATNPNLSPPNKILVPAHSLLYVLESPLFPLSKTGGQIDNITPSNSTPVASSTSLLLPILGPIDLPSLQAFSILHTYLHTRSLAALHHSLTTKPASTSRLPSPPASPKLSKLSLDSSPKPTAATPPPYNSQEALGLLKLVEDLWKSVVKLEIADEGLWETMESSWEELIGRLDSGETERGDR